METKRLIQIAVIVVLLISSTVVIAQNPPHPNGGGAPGSGNTVVGGQQGGAPVGSGNLLLFALALAYAGHKRYKRKEEAVTES